MIESKITTAILIFSLSAEEEARRKPLFQKQKNTRTFYQALLDQTTKITQDLHADVLTIDGSKQEGDDFASKLNHAFCQTYALGYEQVIAIGNDCPGLTTAHLFTAIEQLKNNALVAGPSRDGGVYLIGMQRSCFKSSAFLELPWQQDTLYTAILDQTRSQDHTAYALSSLQDLDTLEDVIAFAKDNPFTAMSLLIRQIIARKYVIPRFFQLRIFSKKRSKSFSLRAPPVLAF